MFDILFRDEISVEVSWWISIIQRFPDVEGYEL